MVTQPLPALQRHQHELEAVTYTLEDPFDALLSHLPSDVAVTLQRALDDLRDRIIRPLVQTSRLQDLPLEFSRIHPQFADSYFALCQLLAQHVGLKILGHTWALLNETREDIKLRSPARLGDEATYRLLVGVDTFGLVTRAIIQRATAGPDVIHGAPDLPDSEARELADLVAAFLLALSCVSFAITPDAEDPIEIRNARQLAEWAYRYAIQCYGLAKRLQLVKVLRTEGKAPSGNQFIDRELLEAVRADLEHRIPDNAR